MAKARKTRAIQATFIETMDCLPVSVLPEGEDWTYEIKLDGYRLEAVKNGSEMTLYSRRQNVLNEKYAYIADALKKLPAGTVIDGELVAMDETGKSNFNALQNFRSGATQIHYVIFDVLMHRGQLLTGVPLRERREILQQILPVNERISQAPVDQSGSHLLQFVREHGLEGVIAKRADSEYECGKRSGVWSKYRINLGQEFVVGGYTPGGHGFDALVVGFYVGKELHFAARVRAGFLPATRRDVFEQIKHLKIDKCPFVNLPEKAAGRWGQGLTAEKMKACIWLKPEAVVRIDFLEWTGANKLRHYFSSATMSSGVYKTLHFAAGTLILLDISCAPRVVDCHREGPAHEVSGQREHCAFVYAKARRRWAHSAIPSVIRTVSDRGWIRAPLPAAPGDARRVVQPLASTPRHPRRRDQRRACGKVSASPPPRSPSRQG